MADDSQHVQRRLLDTVVPQYRLFDSPTQYAKSNHHRRGFSRVYGDLDTLLTTLRGSKVLGQETSLSVFTNLPQPRLSTRRG